MRVFLDQVLAFIDSESLTDDEYDSIPGTLVQGYNQYVYQALRSILQAREAVSYQLKKLKALFVAKGVTIEDAYPARDPASSILFGVALE